MVDKTRCWRELRMALWYVEHSDFVFRVVYGDKECFHLAWGFLGTEYAMPRKAPGWNQHTIVQYDFQDQIVFQHRCQDKWRLAGHRRNASLANEDYCFNLIADLRKRWDGVLWHNPDPTPEEQEVIAVLTGKRFLYRRVWHLCRRSQAGRAVQDCHPAEGPANLRTFVESLPGGSSSTSASSPPSGPWLRPTWNSCVRWARCGERQARSRV